LATEFVLIGQPARERRRAMDYIGHIFRPPSEAESLLLQVTIGCSHNGCTYCGMYRDPVQRFRVKPRETVTADLDQAAAYSRDVEPIRRVFLCDGDALVLSTDRLLEILGQIRAKLPQARRVGIYGDARTILRKGDDELLALREAGLGIVYHGAESGDDEVLLRVDKGSMADDAVGAAAKLKRAGIRHSVMVMLGLGGVERSHEHAAATARLLTAMDPPFVGTLVTTLVPGTPLAAEAEAGKFTLPDPWGMLEELRTLVADSTFTRCRFHANHASNYVPLSLNLPADRDGALHKLDTLLAQRNPRALRPESRRGL
jgi:radical SAM superfamily enzyme YgiQ (UPF0313 family)